jgi:predicted TIM-barrel fold metal-dependent hydrolase
MIIDCHAHVFRHWSGASGHGARDVHRRYLQRTLTRTHARTFRMRDGAAADTKALYRDDTGWAGLRDVDLRVGRFGQIEFTLDGEDYAIQYMPVGMQELTAPPELMLAQMMNAGVDHAILQAGGTYGAVTEYNAYAQKQYPAQFTGLMHVDEAMAGAPENLLAIDRGSGELGLTGVYYNVDGLSRHGFPWELDSPQLAPFWDRLARRKLILCVELTAAPRHDQAGYLRHLSALGDVLKRHPGLKCHLAMGPPAGLFAKNGKWEFPDEALAVYQRDNMVIEVMFPISWGGVWDYPYPEAQALIRDLREKLGADRLIWGSDMPNVERFCTYRQSLDYVRRYCGFLTAREKDLILGETCAAFYGVTRAAQ